MTIVAPQRSRPVALTRTAAFMAALALLGTGAAVGRWTSDGTARPDNVDGVAQRIAADSALAYFDAGKRIHLMFDLDTIPWKTATTTGTGIPPCLRTSGDKADVTAGVVEVNRPWGSGSYGTVLWIECR